jgi:hypothetical protein
VDNAPLLYNHVPQDGVGGLGLLGLTTFVAVAAFAFSLGDFGLHSEGRG